MALEVGKIYIPSGPDEIRRDYLDDLELQAAADGIVAPTQPKTDNYLTGTALGNLAMLEYSNVAIGERNGSVLDAVGQELDEHRAALGLRIVEPSPGTGRVIVSIPGGGPVTINAGEQLLWPNGKIGQVSITFLGALDGDEVSVAATDTGVDTNVDAGETLTFVDPPNGVDSAAEVSGLEPITGGLDEETDERKRDRCLNALRTNPGSGNWGQNIEDALSALSSIQYAFVHPALGGPASRKIVLIRDINPDKNLYSRTPSAAQVEIVRAALHADLPDGSENVIQAVAEETTDVAILVTIPEAAASGGNGAGWLDATQWPILTGGETFTPITASGAPDVVTVDADTALAPLVNQTHVAWWSSVSQKFEIRLIITQTGASGAWVIAFDAPLTDHLGNGPTIGDYICPAAVNMVSYGKTWRDVMRKLGPGENTASGNLLPRALRHPYVTDEWYPSLGVKQLTVLTTEYDEISDADWSNRTLTTPTVPGAVSTAPNVLIPGHFGVYKL